MDDNRWYRKEGPGDDIVLVSRIRLLRNFKDRPFPDKMKPEEFGEVLALCEKKFGNLSGTVGDPVSHVTMEELETAEKDAFLERLLINRAAKEVHTPCAVYYDEEESFSLTLCAQDHVRLLLSARGSVLENLWQKISRIDDEIGAAIPYAFHEQYGFLTSEIRSLGTGMRAYLVMHLPLLAEEKSFTVLQQEIGKYGVVIKEAWSQGARKIGGLYVLYNQRTLGLKETDIIGILTGVSEKLVAEERALRKMTEPVVLRDRVLRAYGLLSYATLLDFSETCRYLSDIQLGIATGILTTETDLSVYELMLGIQPGNLKTYYRENLDAGAIEVRRADYIREFMPLFEVAEE